MDHAIDKPVWDMADQGKLTKPECAKVLKLNSLISATLKLCKNA
jgi:hypothetical protein